MTQTSQNGYSANDRSVIHSTVVRGTGVKVSVRQGPAGDLLLYVASRWHREVEPLVAPDGVLDCWGYAERTIRGSTSVLSNHASGTALDLRARAHPLGKVGTFTTAQVDAIHRILDDVRHTVRWGGDYTGRRDEMHIEVVAPEPTCARILATLNTTENPMPDPAPKCLADPASAVWQASVRNAFGDVVSALQVLNGIEQRLADLQTELAAVKDRLGG
jgi:hypothetical protein